MIALAHEAIFAKVECSARKAGEFARITPSLNMYFTISHFE